MSGNRNELERFVEQVARNQPLLRAPASLESRVLSKLASRQVVWWRSGFVHWPLYARIVFLAASCAFIRLAFSGFVWVTELFDSHEFAGAAMLHRGAQAVSTTASVGDLVLHSIPPMWLYGAAAVAFVLYASLFGLGTVAYRTLYVER